MADMSVRWQVLQAGLDERTGLRESSVVAPCPHDGACPMQGTPSWCHFVQRFERSSLQRITKVRQDGGLARTYQVCCRLVPARPRAPYMPRHCTHLSAHRGTSGSLQRSMHGLRCGIAVTVTNIVY